MDSQQFVTIDGIKVELNGEANLLEVVRKAGIDLPTFCYKPELSVYGACRMCMVENERGMLLASCHTPPTPGAAYKTNTPRLRKYRKNILELLLANHCRDCTTCFQNQDCALQKFARQYGLDEVRFPNTAKSTKGQDTSSPCIERDSGKCILCGLCVRMCNEIQNVGAIDIARRGSKAIVSTAFGKPLAETECVGCGQCAAVCPTGAITVKSDIARIWDAIADPNVTVTMQIAPSVRVGIADELGLAAGENSMGKIVAALHRMGVKAVYDTVISADLTILEETAEFFKRAKEGGVMPLMTSCCPGWIQYVEKKHPEFLPNLSTAKSPMQMFSAVLKEKAAMEGVDTFHIAVMPCTAKKFEAARPEFRTADGKPHVDAVLTTQELIRMVRQSSINFQNIAPEECDDPFGFGSGAGVIFGVTGGVTEAVLRHAAGNNTEALNKVLAEAGQRGYEGVKEFNFEHGDIKLHIAVASGLANAEKVLQRVKAGEKFDFIEVMACPGGCVCGGGQPPAAKERKLLRTQGLYTTDEAMDLRESSQPPVMKYIYDEILKGRAHEFLHQSYVK